MRKSLHFTAVCVLLSATLCSGQKATKNQSCSFEGEVKRGESFVHPGPQGLDFMLEAIPSGWIVRMLKHGVPRSEFDYAGLASPPYMSPNPILISTDFAFRAQDAIGWNPRRFQYFRTQAEMQQGIAAYLQYTSAPPARPTPQSQAGMNKLLQLSAAAGPAQIEILDAHLIGGTANQTQAAALVASHFLATPHVVDQGKPSPLGVINSLRFQVTFPNTSCLSQRNVKQ